jgi:hypothetical protein
MTFFDIFSQTICFIQKRPIFAVRIFEKKKHKDIDHEQENVSAISKKKKKQTRFQKPYGN